MNPLMESIFPTFPCRPDDAMGEDEDGSVSLSPAAVALSAVVLMLPLGISYQLELGLHYQFLFAGLRMVVQLSALGLVLVPIFTLKAMWLVLAYAGFMMVTASIEATSRPKFSYPGMFRNTVLAMTLSCSLVMCYILLVVFDIRPWWEAQYLIPMMGMLLGNTTSSISVALSNLLDELSTRSGMDAIELQLSFGASRYEATESLIRRSIRVCLLPLLNTMSVMGLVSIPGMMTGQVLSGSDPANAARYQMMIMFVITGCSGLAAVFSVYAAVFTIIDSEHCFRHELIMKKNTTGKPFKEQLSQAWSSILACCCCCCGCCAPKEADDALAAPLLSDSLTQSSSNQKLPHIRSQVSILIDDELERDAVRQDKIMKKSSGALIDNEGSVRRGKQLGGQERESQ